SSPSPVLSSVPTRRSSDLLHDVAQLHILLFQTHHGRAGEHDFQVGEAVVAHTQFLAPFRVLEYLVYQQNFSSAALEFGGELHDRSEEHTSELQSRFDLVCR